MGITKEEAFQRIQKVQESMKKRDMDGILNTYASDGAILAAHQIPSRGRAGIEAHYKKHWENPLGANFKLEFHPGELLDGDKLAVMDGKWAAIFEGKEVDHGNYLTVLKLEGNDWKLARSIWNSTLPRDEYIAHVTEMAERYKNAGRTF